jgi:hypothetical protein
VLQANGLFGGGQSSEGGGLGAMSPILKTLMEAGAAYPLVRELMAFGKVDGQALPDKVRELIGQVAPALGDIVQGKSEPAAASLPADSSALPVEAAPARGEALESVSDAELVELEGGSAASERDVTSPREAPRGVFEAPSHKPNGRGVHVPAPASK